MAPDSRVLGCHLVGSMPFEDSEAAFRGAVTAMPSRLKRVTDGETGDRSMFVVWQTQVFQAYPPMMVKFDNFTPLHNEPLTAAQVDEGIDILKRDGIETGYDTAALNSYATFRKLKADGVIPKDVKFQVCLPTTANVILCCMQWVFLPRVESLYEAALFKAMRKIQDEIPHDELAIQIDLAVDTAFWEKASGTPSTPLLDYFQPWWKGDNKEYITKYILRMIEQVDQDVELGIHNCYGDVNHSHWHEPTSLAVVAERAKAFMSQTSHPINFFHCPVPKSTIDNLDAYLAPLKDLLPLFEKQGTELYLGVVHEHHAEMTKKMIAAAEKVVPGGFGVATECGGGRMTPEAWEAASSIATELSAPVS